MITVVVGDQFIPSGVYREALSGGAEPIDVREVTWSGTKAEQHTLQQRMEVAGPNIVPPPPELLAAAESAEALCLHFAPVGAALLAAAPKLRLIAVARSGLENVDLAAAAAQGVTVVPAHGRDRKSTRLNSSH